MIKINHKTNIFTPIKPIIFIKPSSHLYLIPINIGKFRGFDEVIKIIEEILGVTNEENRGDEKC